MRFASRNMTMSECTTNATQMYNWCVVKALSTGKCGTRGTWGSRCPFATEHCIGAKHPGKVVSVLNAVDVSLLPQIGWS